MNLKWSNVSDEWVDIWMLATNLTDVDKQYLIKLDSDYDRKCCFVDDNLTISFEDRFFNTTKWIATRMVNYKKDATNRTNTGILSIIDQAVNSEREAIRRVAIVDTATS